MTYAEAKRVIDVLIDAQILKEKDRNVAMELLMNAERED